MKRVLLTGFEPFGGETINPALKAITDIPDDIEGYEVIKAQIPTVFRESIDKLQENIDRYNPDIIICIGQAGGRRDITIERIGINIDDCSMPDNKGNTPTDQLIYSDGENAYFSSIPIKAIIKNIREADIKVSVSNSAGTYVCNHLLYGLLYYIDKNDINARGGFIHVPYLPEQVTDKPEVPSMELNDMVKAITIAIKTTINNQQDIVSSEGKIF